MPKTFAPTSRASSSERTMLTLTFFSRLPPPTLKTRTPSPARSRETRSHSTKQVSHPSSFTRAVSSLTLSVGAYASNAHSLRKSLTACPACPALPPTPRMNSRPPPARTPASPSATASTLAASSPRMTSMLSARYFFVKLSMGFSRPVEVGDDPSAVEVESKAHGPQAPRRERIVHAAALGRAHVEHEKAAAARSHQLATDGTSLARRVVVLVDRGVGHVRRELTLVGPVLMEHLAVGVDLSGEQDSLCLVSELFDPMHALDR